MGRILRQLHRLRAVVVDVEPVLTHAGTQADQYSMKRSVSLRLTPC